MAFYILLFLCLVVFSANKTFAIIQTLYVENGKNLELGPIESSNQFDIRICEIITNTGTTIKLDTKSEEKNDRFWVNSWVTCRTNIYRMTEKDTGKWQLRTTVNKTSGEKQGIEVSIYNYNIKVRQIYQQKKLIPASRIWAYPDKQVSAHFNEKFPNLSSCKLLNPEQSEYDLEFNQLDDITLSMQCGFKINIKQKFEGEWTLIADLENNTAFYATFNILVRDQEEINPKQIQILLKRGEEGTISIENEPENIKMCILEDPHGAKFPIYTGFCNYKAIITRYHEGIWKAYYGLDGQMELVKREIIVKTYDISQFNSSITYLSNGNINLLCQARTQSMKFCSFERPDGKILHISFGIGNDKYEYYGNGTHSRQYYIMGSDAVNDCGITIHKPNPVDFGSWKCLIRIGSTETVGRILKVSPPSRNNGISKAVVSANNVYVKRGEPFKIKCSADEVLSYCWLRSPNGTVLILHSTSGSEGSELELGDCISTIETATDSDDGKWSCHLGISGGPELESSFWVNLKDTHLMAARDVVVFKNNGQTNLICRPLPESGKIIEACRWVNPRGHGINIDHNGRYSTETENTHCRLSIHMLNFEEDLGQWSCYARFNDGQEEGHARMMVLHRGLNVGSFLSIVLVISMLSCASICLLVLIVCKHRFISIQHGRKIMLGKPLNYP